MFGRGRKWSTKAFFLSTHLEHLAKISAVTDEYVVFTYMLKCTTIYSDEEKR
jgi:hypothetical protein